MGLRKTAALGSVFVVFGFGCVTASWYSEYVLKAIFNLDAPSRDGVASIGVETTGIFSRERFTILVKCVIEVLGIWVGVANIIPGALYVFSSEVVDLEEASGSMNKLNSSIGSTDKSNTVSNRNSTSNSVKSARLIFARLLKDRNTGRFNSFVGFLFAPWLAEVLLVWALRHFILLRQTHCAEVYKNAYIVGRFPLGMNELPEGVDIVVDLTCEFPRMVNTEDDKRYEKVNDNGYEKVSTEDKSNIGSVKDSSNSGSPTAPDAKSDIKQRGLSAVSSVSWTRQSDSSSTLNSVSRSISHYYCIPCLDMTLPTGHEMLDVALRVRKLQQDLNCKVYVHCANGHGRSSLFITLIMMLDGVISKPSEALLGFRKVRPKAGWQPAQERTILKAMELYQEEMDLMVEL